jgi:hypothetical protein
MGRGFYGSVTSLQTHRVRCAALRNPGHGSRKLTRKAKPSVRMERKAKSLAGEMHELPIDSRIAEAKG